MQATLRRHILSVLLPLSLFSAAPVPAEESSAGAELEAAVAGAHRPEANRARDRYRHPVETLSFFGIRPDMTVVEIFPGGGWYTEILAPFLREKGVYYAAGLDPDSGSEFARRSMHAFRDKLEADPELYDRVRVTVLAPPDKTAIAPPGSADMVLTFRNIHNWMAAGTAEQIFAAMFAALKPGGVLGVVEHRGDPAVPQDPKAGTGYVRQDYAIRLAEKAGFKFVADSEVNANPKDTKDYPKGVWTLPPTFAMKDQDREKYLAIGESDRFTLKFVKP
ncbi:MAG: class I SAM-dependent methyltransferase [Gammaproteobacteria bacterium]|nr:class I SAM-dependent methyltransferase [Gammaproteobacteria bacterium]